jgi:hypothetical protein
VESVGPHLTICLVGVASFWEVAPGAVLAHGQRPAVCFRGMRRNGARGRIHASTLDHS